MDVSVILYTWHSCFYVFRYAEEYVQHMYNMLLFFMSYSPGKIPPVQLCCKIRVKRWYKQNGVKMSGIAQDEICITLCNFSTYNIKTRKNYEYRPN